MCIEREESFNFSKILGCKSNCVLLCQLLIIQCIVVGLEYSYRKKSLLKDEYHQLSTFSAWASFHSFWKQFSTHSLTQQKFFSHFQQRSSQLPCSSILSGYIGSPRVFPAPLLTPCCSCQLCLVTLLLFYDSLCCTLLVMVGIILLR